MAWRGRRHIAYKDLKPLMAGLLVGCSAGALGLATIPAERVGNGGPEGRGDQEKRNDGEIKLRIQIRPGGFQNRQRQKSDEQAGYGAKNQIPFLKTLCVVFHFILF
jgi:hypothetical protein